MSVPIVREILAGSVDKLGAVLSAQGVNFALYSKYAKEVFLVLFDKLNSEPTEIIKVENKTEQVWHVFVPGLKAGQLYGYKVGGDYNPKEGLRFNPHKLLIDPYAKAITTPSDHANGLLYAYDLNAEEKDLVMDTRDNSVFAAKSVVVDDTFDWDHDKKPAIEAKDLIIYETHLRGFTASPSSHVKNPGTYSGFIEKIPYLKNIGINAVELLPIQEFYVQDYILNKGLTNYWGYDTIGYFAPSSYYSTYEKPGSQVNEFKNLVKALHKAGIEVILDVVYNHTAEGSGLGPTLCFKGIDNPTYYYLAQAAEDEPYRAYRDDTGCGNTFDIANPAVMRLVLDSLTYWVEEMHVDGFRFDLATVLGHKDGEFNKEAPFFKAIAQHAVLKNVKLIAEPWDIKTYQIGNFPNGWMEWNGKFRDTVRKFIKGDEGQSSELARRVMGSADIYAEQGRPVYESINFITCHDGFTLHDLFAYNQKHNENNQEENRDGTDDNSSWNCGAEGETDDQAILQLRKQMIKNALCCLFFSFGTPMVLGGDEVMRTQKGNNNVWCQDNELSWFDWSLIEKNADILTFFKKAVTFRKMYSPWDPSDQKPHIQWFDHILQDPKWDDPTFKTLCFQFKPMEIKTHNSPVLFVVLNINHEELAVALPQHENSEWLEYVDTARPSGEDFFLGEEEKVLTQQNQRLCAGRSIVILRGKTK